MLIPAEKEKDMVPCVVFWQLRDNNGHEKERREVPGNLQTTGCTASYHQDEDRKDHFIAHPQLIYSTLPPIITALLLFRSCINMLG